MTRMIDPTHHLHKMIGYAKRDLEHPAEEVREQAELDLMDLEAKLAELEEDLRLDDSLSQPPKEE